MFYSLYLSNCLHHWFCKIVCCSIGSHFALFTPKYISSLGERISMLPELYDVYMDSWCVYIYAQLFVQMNMLQFVNWKLLPRKNQTSGGPSFFSCFAFFLLLMIAFHFPMISSKESLILNVGLKIDRKIHLQFVYMMSISLSKVYTAITLFSSIFKAVKR